MKEPQDVVMKDFIQLMRESGLSIPKIARAGGTSHRNIENYMYFGNLPSFPVAIRVLNGLGYKVAVLKEEDIVTVWRKEE